MGRISFFFSGHAVRGTDGRGENEDPTGREMTFDGGEVLTALGSERVNGLLTALEMEL